jgi:hypothetical protein
LKREDLNHTGSHKINNALGQILLARRLGKTEIIAETGAGQHGVATATVCAKFGMKCTIYMGSVSHTTLLLLFHTDNYLGGCKTPSPQRLSHQTPRGPSHRGRSRLPYPSRRCQRSPARLGRQARHNTLYHRVSYRSTPFPHNRPNLPIRHWQRDSSSNAREAG